MGKGPTFFHPLSTIEVSPSGRKRMNGFATSECIIQNMGKSPSATELTMGRIWFLAGCHTERLHELIPITDLETDADFRASLKQWQRLCKSAEQFLDGDEGRLTDYLQLVATYAAGLQNLAQSRLAQENLS